MRQGAASLLARHLQQLLGERYEFPRRAPADEQRLAKQEMEALSRARARDQGECFARVIQKPYGVAHGVHPARRISGLRTELNCLAQVALRERAPRMVRELRDGKLGERAALLEHARNAEMGCPSCRRRERLVER